MDFTSKNEKLKFIIDRYDNYYNNVNTKGNVYLTINTFILTGIVVGFYALDKQIHFTAPVMLLFYFTIASNFSSIAYTLAAIRPYLNKKNDNADGSVIFFGDVADYHTNQYEKLWNEIDEEKWHADLKKQACLLACGLTTKFNRLVYATWFIAAQILFIAVFCIILLNYKIQ